MNIYEIAKEYNNHVLDYIENDDDQALYALFEMKETMMIRRYMHCLR